MWGFNTAINIFIASKFSDKDKIKKHGGRWSPENKQWYFILKEINDGQIIHSFGYTPICLSMPACYKETDEAKILKLINEGNIQFKATEEAKQKEHADWCELQIQIANQNYNKAIKKGHIIEDFESDNDEY